MFKGKLFTKPKQLNFIRLIKDNVFNISGLIIVILSIFTITYFVKYQSLFHGTSQAVGRAYYVSTIGNDSNSGSETQPWRTIQKAANTAIAGDTVFIKQGTYYEKVQPANSGNSSGYITYKNFGDDSVTIDAQKTRSEGIYVSGKSYLKFIGLKVINSASGGASVKITNGSSHIIVDGLTTLNSRFGFNIDGSPTPVTDISINNSTIENNSKHGIYINKQAYDITIENNYINNSGPETYGFGIEVNTRYQGTQAEGPKRIRIIDNEIANSEMQGIRVAHCTDILIKGNYLHHNGATGIQTENEADNIVIEDNISEYNAQTYSYETGIWLDESDNVVVQRNILRHNKFGLMTQGTKHAIIRNNLIYYNNRGPDNIQQAQGIYLHWGNTDNIIVNNTLYKNCDQSGLFGQLTIARKDYAYNPVVKNNIISHSDCRYDLYGDLISNYESDYNNYFNTRALSIYWKGNSLSWQDYINLVNQDNNSITSNPLYENSSGEDFHLQSNSPNVNAGGSLTKTVGNGNGSRIYVEDARYFTDGMGLIDGDEIIIGNNQPVRVVDVDYSSNVISIDKSIPWNNADEVNYVFYGSAPDIGAYEYGEPDLTPTPTPTSTPTTTQTPTPTPTLSPTPTPSGDTLILSPTDDATIDSTSPTTNYGSSKSLEVDNSPVKNILMKFEIPDLSSKVILSAKLRLYDFNGSDKGGDIYRVTDNSWSESLVTWNNSPRTENYISSIGSVSSGNWYEVDLTSFINKIGKYSIKFTSTSNNGADYYSKENSANNPQLVVELGTPAPTPSTQPPTCESWSNIQINGCSPFSLYEANDPLCTTSSETVNVTNDVVGATEVRYINWIIDPELWCHSADYSRGIWEPYDTTKIWNVTSGDGEKKVCAEFRNSAGVTNCGGMIRLESQMPSPTEPPAITSTPTPTPTPTPAPKPGTCTLWDVLLNKCICKITGRKIVCHKK